mmetsp:Transcript_24875/g.85262  ORF Transcript_24875/g.85262 Transcript_24875/m.85262 type:complete len:276 (-) Transcript_24875:32-859(-)
MTWWPSDPDWPPGCSRTRLYVRPRTTVGSASSSMARRCMSKGKARRSNVWRNVSVTRLCRRKKRSVSPWALTSSVPISSGPSAWSASRTLKRVSPFLKRSLRRGTYSRVQKSTQPAHCASCTSHSRATRSCALNVLSASTTSNSATTCTSTRARTSNSKPPGEATTLTAHPDPGMPPQNSCGFGARGSLRHTAGAASCMNGSAAVGDVGEAASSLGRCAVTLPEPRSIAAPAWAAGPAGSTRRARAPGSARGDARALWASSASCAATSRSAAPDG